MFCFRRLTALAVLGSGAVAGCKSDRPSLSTGAAGSAPAGSHPTETVAVTATDFAFNGPAQLAAGANTFQLVNQGKELHQIQLVKLEDGKTVDDLVQALQKPGASPSWLKFVGGPNGIAPGAETRATAVLEPGSYAYICLIPSPDGTMHAAKGMLRAFEVRDNSTATTAALPPASLTIKLLDYDFQSSKPLSSGRHTILVQNAGPQQHELVLLKLAPGKKVEDFAHWAETGLKGPPPGMPLGGVAILDQGGEGTFTVDLTPGQYGLICFVPDAKDGKLHLAHGMMKNITVS